MTHPLTPREKVAQIVRNGMNRLAASQAGSRPVVSASKEADRVTDAILTALASGSGDHAELARLAEAGVAAAESGDLQALADSDQAFFTFFGPRVALALIAENAALRGELDQIAGESIWWKGVVGDGSHQPSGEVRSIKHLHPSMVKPIYEANKGTAVADVIAGLIFSLAITENREQFLVADANERRTEAERKLAEAVELLKQALGDMDRRVITAETANRIDYFISKEAERG